MRSPLAAAGVLIVVAAAPATAQTQYDWMGFAAPAGDAGRGQSAFVELRCTACHEVSGVDGLPDPVAQTRGPDLGPALVDQTRGQIAGSIVSPRLHTSLAIDQEQRARIREAGGSLMADYTDTMTVRQLIDIVAFLRDVDRRGIR